MSTKSSAVVIPAGKDGAPAPEAAAAATKMAGGGLVLSPLPLSGGRRKTRRISKKVLKMLKKMPKAKLAKLMKGGVEDMVVAPESESTETTGASRKTRKGKKSASRRRGFLY